MVTKRPLLRLALFRLRTFRVAVVGSFITRLGAGGVPFLLPLLYQVGLGYTPVQAALFIIPQPIAAMSLKISLPYILAKLGYRRLLLINSTAMGSLIILFATIGPTTPIWLIILQAFLFGLCSSMQYSSMNTLAYADVGTRDTSMASTISSTMQQMSLSFGVAFASLTAAVFVPDRFHSDAAQMVHGIHLAFLPLGSLTIASALVFISLNSEDGSNVSHKEEKL
jgi:Major Facilitator Superfamily